MLQLNTRATVGLSDESDTHFQIVGGRASHVPGEGKRSRRVPQDHGSPKMLGTIEIPLENAAPEARFDRDQGRLGATNRMRLHGPPEMNVSGKSLKGFLSRAADANLFANRWHGKPYNSLL